MQALSIEEILFQFLQLDILDPQYLWVAGRSSSDTVYEACIGKLPVANITHIVEGMLLWALHLNVYPYDYLP